MGFALLDYNGAAVGVNASNTDLSAVTDPDFSQRNNHYIFTEQYQLLGAMMVGANVTRGRFQVPTWNALGEVILFNANRSLQPPSNSQWDWYGPMGPMIPQKEEFQCQVSNNLGAGTEQENIALLLATNDWSANIPRGLTTGVSVGGVFPVRVSFTVTPTINVWSGGQALTFSQSLRGGAYSVVGATVQGTNAAFFRMIFPRYKLYNGRKLRPGGPIQNAVGDFINSQIQPWMIGLGEWGRFHTFEPPTIEVLGTTAGAITYQGFLWLVYLGPDESLLQY